MQRIRETAPWFNKPLTEAAESSPKGYIPQSKGYVMRRGSIVNRSGMRCSHRRWRSTPGSELAPGAVRRAAGHTGGASAVRATQSKRLYPPSGAPAVGDDQSATLRTPELRRSVSQLRRALPRVSQHGSDRAAYVVDTPTT